MAFCDQVVDHGHCGSIIGWKDGSSVGLLEEASLNMTLKF